MAENKRYYWLKLQHDFFSSKRIKKMRRIEKGDTCLIIYLKMQLKSIKNNGILEYAGLEETFEEELALDLDEEPEDVKRTVEFLLKYDLMIPIENQYELPYAQSNIGSETAAAERMREARKRKNEVQQSANNVEQKTKIVPIEKPKEKPKRETTLQIYDRLKERGVIVISPKVETKMRIWLQYKTEKKESYQETGLQTLINKVNRYVDKYSEDAMCKLIDDCISSNYSGIIWDWLDKGKIKTKAERIESRVSEVDNW